MQAAQVITVSQTETTVSQEEGSTTIVAVSTPIVQVVEVGIIGEQGVPGDPGAPGEPGPPGPPGTTNIDGITGLGSGVATALGVDVGEAGSVLVQGDATTADIADSADKRYVTDEQLTVLGNTSGTNTGDQTITLSGDVSGSGTSGIAATLATVNSSVGTYGSATQASVVTVNAKGLVTSASQSTVTPAVGSITGVGTGVATALGVNVGTDGAFVVRGGNAGTPSALVATNASGTATNLAAGQSVVTQSFSLGTFYMPFISGFANGNYDLRVNNYYTLNPVTGVFGCGGIQLFSTTQAIRFQGNAYIEANSIGTGRYTPFSNASSNSILRAASGGLRIESNSGTEIANFTNGGILTMPLQPEFSAYVTSTQSNVTGDGTVYSLGNIYTTTRNQNSCFANGIFTARAQALHDFTIVMSLLDIAAGHTFLSIELVVNGSVSKILHWSNPAAFCSSNILIISCAETLLLSGGDTVQARVTVSGSTKVIDVQGTNTRFSGGQRI